MRWTKSGIARASALVAAFSALWLAFLTGESAAQSEPPLTIPPIVPLPPPGAGIPVEGWLLFPSIRTYSIYSDNLFQSPVAPVKAFGLGVTPTLTAQWTNGIHSTTFFGSIDRQVYPTDDAINTFDGETSITQKYSPLPDLTFTGIGDYTHKTIAGSLTNSIPTPVTSPNSILLPNGDTELPNGTIISPAGQIVGHSVPLLTATGTTLVNPYDQYTGTFAVNKIFNHGVLTVSGSLARTDYENPGTPGFTTKTFREDGAYWLGPVFYAYSNGTFSMRDDTSPNPNSNAYRLIGGIGTRQFGFFRASFYVGHQGSEVQGSGTAGGALFGGKLTYYPTLNWTVTGSFDETINNSTQTIVSTEAQTLPTDIPILIPISSSTQTTHSSLQSQYRFSPQWVTVETLGLTHIAYGGSTRDDNVWLADAVLNYDLLKNLTLTWEYQFTSVVSNAPFVSTNRNFLSMGANYRF